MINQIVLVTDGCSNVGIEPGIAAAHARAEGIVVNVIGVIDQGHIGERGAAEIAEIAEAGGGMYRIVRPRELSQTMQMMTRATVVQTIQQAVQRELKQIMDGSVSEKLPVAANVAPDGGSGANEPLAALPPDKRAQVVEVIDDLSENSFLRIALLVDTSASMRPKLAAVEAAIRDLALSLRARRGRSELCLFHYPGTGRFSDEAEMICDWTTDLAAVDQLSGRLKVKGATPTGPALMKVVGQFVAARDRSAMEERKAE